MPLEPTETIAATCASLGYYYPDPAAYEALKLQHQQQYQSTRARLEQLRAGSSRPSSRQPEHPRRCCCLACAPALAAVASSSPDTANSLSSSWHQLDPGSAELTADAAADLLHCPPGALPGSTPAAGGNGIDATLFAASAAGSIPTSFSRSQTSTSISTSATSMSAQASEQPAQPASQRSLMKALFSKAGRSAAQQARRSAAAAPESTRSSSGDSGSSGSSTMLVIQPSSEMAHADTAPAWACPAAAQPAGQATAPWPGPALKHEEVQQQLEQYVQPYRHLLSEAAAARAASHQGARVAAAAALRQAVLASPALVMLAGLPVSTLPQAPAAPASEEGQQEDGLATARLQEADDGVLVTPGAASEVSPASSCAGDADDMRTYAAGVALEGAVSGSDGGGERAGLLAAAGMVAQVPAGLAGIVVACGACGGAGGEETGVASAALPAEPLSPAGSWEVLSDEEDA